MDSMSIGSILLWVVFREISPYNNYYKHIDTMWVFPG